MDARDTHLDNLKGILIYLVVFAHVLERIFAYEMDSYSLVAIIYAFIYSFHMPAFIFISGYFSKKYHSFGKYTENLVKSTLLPFILFNSFYWMVFSRKLNMLFYPQWAMWYLLSLFYWKLIVHPISRLKGNLILAIMLSLIFGISKADTFLSLQRSVSFFPYFLAGYLTPESTIRKTAGKNKTEALLLFMAAISIVLILTYRFQMPVSVYSMSLPYEMQKLTITQGVIFRAIVLIVGVTGIYWLFCLIPEKRSVFTMLGQNTLTVYIFHPFFIKLYNVLRIPRISSSVTMIGFAALYTLVICAIFGNSYVSKLYKMMIERIAKVVMMDGVNKT